MMDNPLLEEGEAVPFLDLKLVAGGLNPQPEPPGRSRLDVVTSVPVLLGLHELRAVAGGLNPQPLPPRAFHL
jgi:hypothetical protein